MYEELHQLLSQLRLKGMDANLDHYLLNAQRDGTAIADVIHQLLVAEYQHQKMRSMENRIKSAKMPWSWSIDTFPFKDQPAVKRSQIMSLAKLDFINQAENIALIGHPGTGKTGLAISLLRLALINGYRGRFFNAQELLNDLYTSLADRKTSNLLRSIAAYDIIIIDELGYLTLTPEQVNIFFKLIDMRYHKKSTIITTNLEYSQWYDIFKNKPLVDAMIDRFRHQCTTISIKGDSLRSPKEIKQDSKKTTEVS